MRRICGTGGMSTVSEEQLVIVRWHGKGVPGTYSSCKEEMGLCKKIFLRGHQVKVT